MFPSLASDDNLRPILNLCLASLLKHEEFLRHQLPSSHALLSTYLFRDAVAMAQLQDQLVVNDSAWMRPTGVPPYVEIYK
jgi:hypothetical protein